MDSHLRGLIFDIQGYSVHDGSGCRTLVFLSGCPLRCTWCSNPEGQLLRPRAMYRFKKCVHTHYRCVEACPNKATTVSPEGAIEIDRSLCKNCGQCVEVCPNKAREISGKLMTVEEVLEEVKKDTLFYQNSGGGVTASGGEPTHQPEFLWHLFRRCQKSAIHTCLDTCGFVQTEALQRVLEHTNMVLYDIKHMDPVRHRELIGVDNRLILENARMVAAQGKPMIIRLPLIPGHNDSEQDIKALAEFMTELGLKRIDLLPYHSLGKEKYARLGLEYKLSDLKPHESEEVGVIKSFLESHGLEVGVG